MNELLQLATTTLMKFLATHLPKQSADWWKKHVEDRLSFQQQRIVQERGFKTLE
jgi:ATP-dependent helicase HepA